MRDDNLFLTYNEHFKRMLNELPSKQITPKDIERALRPWMSEVRKNSKILDIGCGYGHQLYILSKLEFTNLFGIDICKDSIRIARDELNGDAIIEEMDAFDFLPRYADEFDLIILNHILEHIPCERTIEILTMVKSALKQKGIVVINVPNMSSLLSSYSRYLDFTHVVGFTEFSLMQVLDAVGFKNHCIVKPKIAIDFSYWRPWRPLKGLGFRRLANKLIHQFLYKLRGQDPIPMVFDMNLEIYSRKP